MAQTRYGDLRDTFYLSRLTNNGLLRHADFSASCWKVLFTRNHGRGATQHERERTTHWRCFIRSPRANKMAPGRVKQGMVVPTGFEPVFKP